MNAASRGAILAVLAVALGAIILSQGFDDPANVAAPAPATSEDGEDNGSGGDGGSDSSDDATNRNSDSDDGSSGADSGSSDDGGEGESGSETSGTTSDDGPPDILHSPIEVRVLVANGTTVQGAAGRVNNQLIALGFNGLPPTNTDPIGSATETAIYYVDGYLLDAQSIALKISASTAAVQPIPTELSVGDLAEANVVIILGPDLVSTD